MVSPFTAIPRPRQRLVAGRLMAPRASPCRRERARRPGRRTRQRRGSPLPGKERCRSVRLGAESSAPRPLYGCKRPPEKETHLREFSITHNKLEPIYKFCRPLNWPAPRSTPQRAAVLRDVDRHFGRGECAPLQAFPRGLGYQPLPIARVGDDSSRLRQLVVGALPDCCAEKCVRWMSYMEYGRGWDRRQLR
jgi:hypothetical protein